MAFAGPALCMVACAALTPPGASHAAGSLVPGVTAAIVALLSVSFALGAWARAGLYCNHQVLLDAFPVRRVLQGANTEGGGVVGTCVAHEHSKERLYSGPL